MAQGIERSARSDYYQHLYHEVHFEDKHLCLFPDERMYGQSAPPQVIDRLYDLEDELRAELWAACERGLTRRQYSVIKLYASGLTQVEVGKELGICQTLVAKAIGGKTMTSTGLHVHTYGGVLKRVSPIVRNSHRLHAIASAIARLYDPAWRNVWLPLYGVLYRCFGSQAAFAEWLNGPGPAPPVVVAPPKRESYSAWWRRKLLETMAGSSAACPLTPREIAARMGERPGSMTCNRLRKCAAEGLVAKTGWGAWYLVRNA